MRGSTGERLKLHEHFWKGEKPSRFPVSFRLGDYFFATKFKAARHLLKPGLEIKPEMLKVDDYLEDYERIFQEVEQTGQDGFWTAEPFTVIPWMEAILGCPVFAGDHSFITEPGLQAEVYFPDTGILEENSWYRKYMEFTTKLVTLSSGRFPVGQPIMRGPSDMMGALLGQTRLIYEMNDEPEKMQELADIVTHTFRTVIKNQFEQIPVFHGGYSIGFYHLWTPGRCIWFQEDLSALLSPGWYRNFIRERDEEICRPYEYTAVHLHPVSFHILDDLLEIESLKAIEINKDIGGPSIKEMMPVFRRVLEGGKRLMLWGTLDEADLIMIKRELSGSPVFLNIVAEDLDLAKRLKALIE